MFDIYLGSKNPSCQRCSMGAEPVSREGARCCPSSSAGNISLTLQVVGKRGSVNEKRMNKQVKNDEQTGSADLTAQCSQSFLQDRSHR